MTKDKMMQMQMLRTQINSLENSKLPLDSQYSILWLAIWGLFFIIPWFFIPGKLKQKNAAIARIDSQIRDIESQIQMLQFSED
jgi:prefoldin subunit 5